MAHYYTTLLRAIDIPATMENGNSITQWFRSHEEMCQFLCALKVSLYVDTNGAIKDQHGETVGQWFFAELNCKYPRDVSQNIPTEPVGQGLEVQSDPMEALKLHNAALEAKGRKPNYDDGPFDGLDLDDADRLAMAVAARGPIQIGGEELENLPPIDQIDPEVRAKTHDEFVNAYNKDGFIKDDLSKEEIAQVKADYPPYCDTWGNPKNL